MQVDRLEADTNGKESPDKDVRDSAPQVQVVVRCRPLSEREISSGHESIVEFENSRRIVINEIREQPASNTGDRKQLCRAYEFNRVFDWNSSQIDIYQKVCAPIVDSTLEGYNGTIFAYGQTGTGKTYTMEGAASARLRARRKSSTTARGSSAARKESIQSNNTNRDLQPPSSSKKQSTAEKKLEQDGKLQQNCEDNQDETSLGVIPRAFKHIFKHIASHPEVQFLVRASYLQLYQEELHDLLRSSSSSSKDNKGSTGESLELHERPDIGVYVKDLTSIVCKSVTEIERVMRVGNKNRAVGATDMNEYSSRSHAIFMITIEQQSKGQTDSVGEKGPQEVKLKETSNNVIRVGKLNLIDLAGSERQRKTNSLGERQRESVKINLSLSALGNVINSLMKVQRQQHQTKLQRTANNQKGALQSNVNHVPYRDSKLTRLMQDSLGGNAKTLMIAHIGPASYNYDETINTLNYASRAKLIRNMPKLNEDPKDALLRELQREIHELRTKLASMDVSTSEDPLAKIESKSQQKEQQESEITARKSSLKADTEVVGIELADLKKKLSSLESKLLNGGVTDTNLAYGQYGGKNLQSQSTSQLDHELLQAHTQKQELELEQSRARLADQANRERAVREQLERHQELELVTKESFSSIQQELEAKRRLIRQILIKVQSLRQDIDAAQMSQRLELDELDQLQYNLIKELKLKCLIMDNFIPNEHVSQILPRVNFDERTSSCKLKPLDDLPLLNGERCKIFADSESSIPKDGDLWRPKYTDLWDRDVSLRPKSEFECIEETISPANIRFKYENLIETKLSKPEALARQLGRHKEDSLDGNRQSSALQRVVELALNEREPNIVI